MSLIDDLQSPDDMVRLLAVERAGRHGDPELVDTLLDLALNDSTEVRTTGGVAEVYQNVSDAAAQAVRSLLEPTDGLDPRIRAAVTDLAYDDERVAKLLYYLGARYEPLRRELETSDEDRLRWRALTAVLSIHRTAELTGRFIFDPAPAVRIEATRAKAGVADLERLLRDPVPAVRKAAVDALRWVKDSEAYVAAARMETDPLVRHAFIDGFRYRRRDRPVQLALIGYLAHPGAIQSAAADLLARIDDPGVAAAIASRILLEGDDRSLWRLLDYAHLLAQAPELRPALEHLRRHTPDSGLHGQLATLLAAPAAAYPSPDPAAGLDPEHRARLHREALRWAVVALDPVAADRAELGALDILRGWLDAPGARLPESTVAGVVGECLRAAASGDLRAALDAGVEAAVEAARRDPAGDDSATVVDPRRAVDLARLAQLFTARQIRAGVDPLPPRRLRSLLLNGPDALTVGTTITVPSLPLGLRRPRAVTPTCRPDRAAWLTRCANCAAPLRLQGPLEWKYRDDDRTVESEDGFAGFLDGTCAACAARRRVEVRLDLAISRGDGSAELTWYAVEEIRAPA